MKRMIFTAAFAGVLAAAAVTAEARGRGHPHPLMPAGRRILAAAAAPHARHLARMLDRMELEE